MAPPCNRRKKQSTQQSAGAVASSNPVSSSTNTSRDQNVNSLTVIQNTLALNSHSTQREDNVVVENSNSSTNSSRKRADKLQLLTNEMHKSLIVTDSITDNMEGALGNQRGNDNRPNSAQAGLSIATHADPILTDLHRERVLSCDSSTSANCRKNDEYLNAVLDQLSDNNFFPLDEEETDAHFKRRSQNEVEDADTDIYKNEVTDDLGNCLLDDLSDIEDQAARCTGLTTYNSAKGLKRRTEMDEYRAVFGTEDEVLLEDDSANRNQNSRRHATSTFQNGSEGYGGLSNTKSNNAMGRNGALQNIAAVARAGAASNHQGQLVGQPLGWQATKHSLKERFSFMFCNEVLADVHFIVGRGDQRQRIPAHRFLLSTGSAVFDAMFNGAMAGSHSLDIEDIDLPDVEAAAFLALLKFLYSDDVQIGPESVMTTLYTAKKYAVPALENACVDFLKHNLNADNSFMLLTQARLFDEPHLAALCLEMIDKHTTEALNADSFPDIDLETLCAVMERDTLRIREAPLYSQVVRWSTEECHRQQLPVTPGNQRNVLSRALSLIRFPLMTVEEFAQSAAQGGILTDREVVNLFLYFTVNPKPVSCFLDVPRCSVTGKEQLVNRFQRIEGRWGYSGTPDRIKFTVDRRIFVLGFGLYGSIHGPTEYQVIIQIIHCGTGKVLASNETTFSCDGSSATFRVLFKEPVEITPSVTYIASACLKGPDSHYGTKGLRRIVHQSPSSGCVTFQFTYAAGNNNGTSVEDGQIPEIIFYTKLT